MDILEVISKAYEFNENEKEIMRQLRHAPCEIIHANKEFILEMTFVGPDGPIEAELVLRRKVPK